MSPWYGGFSTGLLFLTIDGWLFEFKSQTAMIIWTCFCGVNIIFRKEKIKCQD